MWVMSIRSVKIILYLYFSLITVESFAHPPLSNEPFDQTKFCSKVKKDLAADVRVRLQMPAYDRFAQSLVDHYRRSLSTKGFWAASEVPVDGRRLTTTSDTDGLRLPAKRVATIIQELEAEGGEFYLIEKGSTSHFGVTADGKPFIAILAGASEEVLEHEYTHFSVKRKLASRIAKEESVSKPVAYVRAFERLFSPKGILYDESRSVLVEFEFGATPDDNELHLIGKRIYPLQRAVERGIDLVNSLRVEINRGDGDIPSLKKLQEEVMTSTELMADDLIRATFQARIKVAKRLREHGANEPLDEVDLEVEPLALHIQKWLIAEWLEEVPESANEFFIHNYKNGTGELDMVTQFAWQRYLFMRKKIDYRAPKGAETGR